MQRDIGRQHHTFDAELLLAEEVTHATTGTKVGQVDAVDQVLDLGSGRINGHWILDVSALALDGNDEGYEFRLIGSDQDDLSADTVLLASMKLGALETLVGDQDLGADRYVVPFTNQVARQHFRYVQVQLVIAGATVSITWSSYLNKNPY